MVPALAAWWLVTWAFYAYVLLHPGPDTVLWLAGSVCLVVSTLLTCLHLWREDA